MMKKNLKNASARVACLAVLALATTNTRAALQCYEPYNYTLGTLPLAATGVPTQTTGGGFTGPYNGGGGTRTTGAGLTYPNLLTANNALDTTGGYIGENVASPISTGPVYISYLINMPTNAVGALSGLEMNSGGNGMFVGIISTIDGTSGTIGVNQQVGYNDAGPNLWAGVPISYGTTHFIVVELTGSGSGWTGRIWVDPAAGTNAIPTETGSFTVPQFTIAACTVVTPGAVPNTPLKFDELRIASSWNDAVSYAPPTPLNVTITSPANGATVGNFFTIAATASVFPGAVTNVAFYDGATLLGGDTTSPYSYSANLLAGGHTLTAVAQANTGASLTSAVVNITVTNVPPLVVYEPFNYTLGGFANNTPATGTGLAGNWTVGNGTIIAGQTYPSLLVSNNALSMTGSRTEVAFATPVSSGTKYFSFLFNQLGNNGGNLNGLYFKGSGVNSLIAGITAPFSGAAGSLGLGSIASVSAGATGIAAFSGQQFTGLFTYSQTHLVVVKIDFDTAGNNDTVTMWLDPAAGTSTPTGTPITWSAFDVGAISGIGINVQGGGNADIFDEIHVGDTFGSVVTDIPIPLSVAITSPTNSATVDESFSITATAAVNPGTIANVDFYLDGNLLGSDATSPYSYPASGVTAGAHTLQAIAQDSFANSVTSAPVSINVVVIPPTVISAYESFNYGTLANGDASTATGFTGNWTIAGTANIIGNLSYPSLPTINSAFQQSPGGQRNQVSLGTTLVKGTVYLSFLYNQTGDNGGNINGLYLPGSGATSLYVGLTGPWSGAAGKLGLGTITTAGGASGISLLAEMPGPFQVMNYNQTNLIVVQIDFNTSGNNDTISLWLNPTAGVTNAAGNFNDPNPDLTVTSYDVGTINAVGFNFQGGGAVQQYDEIRLANTFGEAVGYAVAPGVNTTPTNLVSSVSGDQLTLAWPADRTGWKLESQTNSLSTGLGTNWFEVSGSTTTNQMTFTVDPAAPAVFYRMTYP